MSLLEAETSTPDDLAELTDCVHNLCHRAKREFPRVGSEDNPTPWDRRHAAINEKLTEWQASCPR